jgi:hypothetical protein
VTRMVPPDHNAARWLDVRHLDEPQTGGCWHGPGWYVVRTCPCHKDRPVTLPLASITDAYRAKAAMLAVSGD